MNEYSFLSREQLHELVWSKPVTQLARQMGLSSTDSLRRACQEARVPKPTNVYWKALAAGRRARVTKLPRRELCQLAYVWFMGSIPAELASAFTGEAGEPRSDLEDIESMEYRFRRALGNVSYPLLSSRISQPIRRVLDLEATRRATAVARGWHYSTPRYTQPWEQERLRILNAIILGLQKIGGGGTVTGEQAENVTLRIRDLRGSISLDRVDHPGSDELVLTGPCGRYIEGKRWHIHRGRGLTDIVVGIAVSAEIIHREKPIREREMEEGRKQYEADILELRRKAREKARSAEEQAQTAKLLQDAVAFDEAEKIRRYIAAALERDPDSAEVQAWAAQARSYADELDPLLRRPPSLI